MGQARSLNFDGIFFVCLDPPNCVVPVVVDANPMDNGYKYPRLMEIPSDRLILFARILHDDFGLIV